MVIKEYEKENTNTIMLLHGGGLSWWNYREEAEILSNEFHVVLPILDGHAESDRDFIDINSNATEIITYIDDNYDGKVMAICGLSLGAQVLIEILSIRADICRYSIIESALIEEMPLVNYLIEPLMNISYWMITKRWFAKLQFQSLKIRQELFEDYYRDSRKISKKSMIAFLKANSKYQVRDDLHKSKAKVLILVGSKEPKKIISSAHKLNRMISRSELKICKGYTHGEISLNHPIEYVDELLTLMR